METVPEKKNKKNGGRGDIAIARRGEIGIARRTAQGSRALRNTQYTFLAQIDGIVRGGSGDRRETAEHSRGESIEAQHQTGHTRITTYVKRTH
jgi:hypothetical protein